MNFVTNKKELGMFGSKIRGLMPAEFKKYLDIIQSDTKLPEEGFSGYMNLMSNLDRYEILENVKTFEDLAKYHIDTDSRYDVDKIHDLLDYVKYDEFGRHVNDAEMPGVFSEAGFIKDRKSAWEIVYKADGTEENGPTKVSYFQLDESEPDVKKLVNLSYDSVCKFYDGVRWKNYKKVFEGEMEVSSPKEIFEFLRNAVLSGEEIKGFKGVLPRVSDIVCITDGDGVETYFYADPFVFRNVTEEFCGKE